MIRLATDVGGTFTDLVGFDDATGRLFTAKSLTTPHHHAQGVVDVIVQAIAEGGLDPVAIGYFVHGGTTVINAILERKGVRTALVTTRGFRDVLEIGRGNRPDLYNLRAKTPDPFVPRALRFEITERVAADGSVVRPLAEEELAPIAEACRNQQVQAVAIVFLHSYRNPEHERRCADALRAMLPGVTICASHEISREWREYERTSTAVLNAYVQPIAARYVENLSGELEALRISRPYYLMQSNGGVTRFEQAVERPLTLIESGPAGGVAGAIRVGEALGLDDVLYLDVGGTTAKCSLIRAGRPEILSLYRLEHTRTSPGHTVQVPVVDIVEIGAGGGSIIRTDAAGRLRVGPDSAGANPGPVCYGLGGSEPTLTDAATLLGYLDPEHFAAGRMKLDASAARRSFETLGASIGRSAEEIAADAWRIAIASMISALKLVTVERGHDPRRLTLIVSGGAGPLFAAQLGAILQCRQVVIPPFSGNFSAWGMLAAPPRFHLRHSFYCPLVDASLAAVVSAFDDLAAQAHAFHGAATKPRLSHFLDMRYAGQEHSVTVEIGAKMTASAIATLFHTAHERAYSFSIPDGAIEITNVAIMAELDVALVSFPAAGSEQVAITRAPRRVYISHAAEVTTGNGAWSATPVFERHSLPPGWSASGPALIEESSSTTVVHSGQRAHVAIGGILCIDHASSENQHALG
ncbi:MAG: hydantoinase/oxoprolinase family protein [Alphaproteobacteria bacterium]|nr:hydantoinase/oxoprolinase family protein [Alphaproteobacteria bacterium]